MAWSKAQMAAAKKIYKSPGNKKTWPECIKAVTSGGVVGRAKSKPVKTVIKKTVVRRPVSVRIGNVENSAMKDLQATTQKIQFEEAFLQSLKSGAVGADAAKKRVIAKEVQRRKSYISELKKHKNALKRFV